jgi:succinate dehydrogenase hydrophobic anchor subunit
MKKIFISLSAVLSLVLPVVAFAQAPNPDFTYTTSWINQIMAVASKAVTFLMVIATLYFIWTVISYIRVKEAKDAEEKKKAMLRGIIGLVVIVGIWGIVSIITRTFDIRGGSLPTNNVACPPGQEYNTILKACN